MYEEFLSSDWQTLSGIASERESLTRKGGPAYLTKLPH
jgi:hypothetical protein